MVEVSYIINFCKQNINNLEEKKSQIKLEFLNLTSLSNDLKFGFRSFLNKSQKLNLF